jgi:hypothetical protein
VKKIPTWPRENPSSRGKNTLPKRKTLHGEEKSLHQGKISSREENPFTKAKILPQ